MISYKEANELIKKEFNRLNPGTEIIQLQKVSHHTLAENVYSDLNLPPFNNSAVDGIAIKHNDQIHEWEVIGEISAGNYTELIIDNNSAVSIMTGAKLPRNCDTVIPIEDISIDNNRALLKSGIILKPGQNIRRQGSDINKGELAVGKGTFIRSRHMATLASCGKSKVPVYQQLKIAVLATGDELIDVDKKPAEDKIRVSNIYALSGIIEELHQTPINLGFVGDNREELKTILKNNLESEIDILITTGGASVGKYDYVVELFKELGVKQLFWKVNIKPGKPIFFGMYEKQDKVKLVFGLPGNPVSALVNFEVLIKPFILEKYGMDKVETATAILANDIRKTDNKRHFLKAHLKHEAKGTFIVSSQRSQSSGNLVEFSKANCLIEIEEDRLNPRKGEIVKCIKM